MATYGIPSRWVVSTIDSFKQSEGFVVPCEGSSVVVWLSTGIVGATNSSTSGNASDKSVPFDTGVDSSCGDKFGDSTRRLSLSNSIDAFIGVACFQFEASAVARTARNCLLRVPRGSYVDHPCIHETINASSVHVGEFLEFLSQGQPFLTSSLLGLDVIG